MSFLIVFLFGIGILVANFILVVVVYKDANNRGLNGALWALVVIFLPGFIGVILYLILRSEYLVCQNCKNRISDEYANCPYCGRKLKKECSKCGTRLEDSWKVCPNCGTNTIYNQEEIYTKTVNTKKNDIVLKTLIGVIIGSVILVILFIFIFTPMGIIKSHTTVINESIEEEVEYIEDYKVNSSF